MSRNRLLFLLIPILTLLLACQTVMRPINDIQNVANTAEAIVTKANDLPTQMNEMLTQVAPMATTYAETQAVSTSPSPDMDGTPSPGSLMDPQGVPLSTWNDIPVMPEALAGAEAQGMYSFRINASSKEINDFYAAALPPLGWSSLFSTTDMPIYVYTRENQVLSITITELEGGAIVLLSIA